MPRGLNTGQVAANPTYSGDMGASGGASRGNTRTSPTGRVRGHIERLKSGSLRVRVYAGQDRLLRKDLYLKKTVAAGPDANDRAEKLRDELIFQVETGNHPKTDGNVDQLMAAYLDENKRLGRKSLDGYRGNHRKHISPLLGRFKINGRQVDEDLIDQFYSELERCRDHCGVAGTRPVGKHWTPLEHRCDRRCRPHVCKPLKPWTIHKIHSQLNGAFKYAKRKKWALVNPFEGAEPPPVPKGQPQPPSVRETALIIDAAWNGTYYGPAVWFASTTGARLGELCALRWRDLTVQHVDISHDIDGHDPYECLRQGCHWVLSISRSIEQVGVEVWEKGTKTHQHRRIALDNEDAAVLIDLRQAREEEGKRTGRPVLETDFIIHHPDGPEVCLRPGAVSMHYSRFVATLPVSPTTFHKLRHYTATELIAAGIDVNTVAGRLGHASATTTYNFYAAWKQELDQRAAIEIHGRVPTPPAPSTRARPAKAPVAELLAQQLRTAIIDGQFQPHTHLPPMKDLATEYRVSINAAHAAVNQLSTWGFVTVSRGKRSTVTDQANWPEPPPTVDRAPETVGEPPHAQATQPVVTPPEPVQAADPADRPDRREALDLEIVRLGQRVRTYRTHADPDNSEELLHLLLDAVRRSGGQPADVRDYELVVRYAGERGVVTTFIAPPNVASIFPGVAA